MRLRSWSGPADHPGILPLDWGAGAPVKGRAALQLRNPRFPITYPSSRVPRGGPALRQCFNSQILQVFKYRLLLKGWQGAC